MLFWIAIALMTTGAVLALIMPLLRRQRAGPSAREHDLAVYRDQLSEVERDRANGLLSETEAGAARLEIERRILRQAADATPAPVLGGTAMRVAAALAITIGVPVLAVALYLRVGAPGRPDLPLAQRPASAEPARLAASLKAELDRRLADKSGTLSDWVGLAHALMGTSMPEEAALAYERAAELAPERAELYSARGEALIEANGGTVVPEARAAFERALEIDPEEPRARFYRGAALAQAGDLAGAVDAWLELERDSPAGAPWLGELQRRLNEVATAGKIDLAQRRAAIGQADQPAGGAQTANVPIDPKQRGAMIRAMVDGLAERLKTEPDDLEGWRRLARSYMVLGERQKALEAHAAATKLAPDSVDVLLDYAHAIYPPGQASGSLPAEVIQLMRRILALSPEHAEALFFVGEAEAEAGNRAEAVTLWRKLLAKLDPGSATYAAIQKRIEAQSQTN